MSEFIQIGKVLNMKKVLACTGLGSILPTAINAHAQGMGGGMMGTMMGSMWLYPIIVIILLVIIVYLVATRRK